MGTGAPEAPVRRDRPGYRRLPRPGRPSVVACRAGASPATVGTPSVSWPRRPRLAGGRTPRPRSTASRHPGPAASPRQDCRARSGRSRGRVAAPADGPSRGDELGRDLRGAGLPTRSASRLGGPGRPLEAARAGRGRSAPGNRRCSSLARSAARSPHAFGRCVVAASEPSGAPGVRRAAGAGGRSTGSEREPDATPGAGHGRSAPPEPFATAPPLRDSDRPVPLGGRGGNRSRGAGDWILVLWSPLAGRPADSPRLGPRSHPAVRLSTSEPQRDRSRRTVGGSVDGLGAAMELAGTSGIPGVACVAPE